MSCDIPNCSRPSVETIESPHGRAPEKRHLCSGHAWFWRDRIDLTEGDEARNGVCRVKGCGALTYAKRSPILCRGHHEAAVRHRALELLPEPVVGAGGEQDQEPATGVGVAQDQASAVEPTTALNGRVLFACRTLLDKGHTGTVRHNLIDWTMTAIIDAIENGTFPRRNLRHFTARLERLAATNGETPPAPMEGDADETEASAATIDAQPSPERAAFLADLERQADEAAAAAPSIKPRAKPRAGIMIEIRPAPAALPAAPPALTSDIEEQAGSDEITTEEILAGIPWAEAVRLAQSCRSSQLPDHVVAGTVSYVMGSHWAPELSERAVELAGLLVAEAVQS